MDFGYQGTRRVMLADDDDDDRLLFLDVLKELNLPVSLSSANNGEMLMQALSQTAPPDILFLDLNMPLKNGFECLVEIRRNSLLDGMPVVIFSTSSQPSAIDKVYSDGAQLYIRKPNDFTQLKNVIHHVITMDWKSQAFQVEREQFVLKMRANGK